MTEAEVVTAAKDVVLAVAAVVTVTVAARGLKTWRRQLKGTAEFETARALARATYKLREEIQLCRAPFFSVGEYPPDYDGLHPSREQEAKLWQHIYKNRWAPVAASLEEFDASALEAEALWGREVRVRTDKLRDCVKRLNIAIHAIIGNAAEGGEISSGDREYGTEMRKEATAASTDEDNPLSKDIRAAVAGIEEMLQPHLRKL